MQYVQLHGLVPPGTRPQPTSPQHEVLPCGPVSALISYVSRLRTPGELPPEEVANWAMTHNAILMTYCDKTTVVPMALGAVFSSKAAIISELTTHMDAHVHKMHVLRDIQEFSVQLTIVSPPKTVAATAKDGREFLQMQRARRDLRENLHRDRQSFAQNVIRQLQTPTVQIEASASSKPDRLLNFVVLIRQTDVVHLQRMARELHEPAENLGLDLVITGPWPPYSSNALKLAARDEVSDVVDT